MGKFLGVSDKELEILEAWAKHGSLLAGAEALKAEGKINHISAAYNRVARLKWRYRTAKMFIREFERWAAKLPSPLESF